MTKANKRLISAAMLVGLAMWAGHGTEAQGGPLPEPPPSKGVCDELIGATPGLYGLCVGFCGAQDCEPDFELEDPFENCTPFSEKLLANYGKRKQESDPDMPCIKTPCPCWTPNELASLVVPEPPYSSYICRSEFQDGILSDFWFQFHDPRREQEVTMSVRNNIFVGKFCSFWHLDSAISIDGIFRYYSITDAEYERCRPDVIATGKERGFDCWD